MNAGEVHVHRLRLNGNPEPFWPLLSDTERAQARRFHFDEDRSRYITAHGQLRRILSDYTGRGPTQLRFGTRERDKPFLLDSPLEFNLSHARDRALVAIATVELGVDIEDREPQRDLDAIARRYFSPVEVAVYERTAAAERLELFYTLWTRKEAYLKAMGGGLSIELSGFDVLTEDSNAPALTFRVEAQAAGPFTLCDLEVGEGYAAALVTRTSDPFTITYRG